MTHEAVVLVDEENRVLGTMPKGDVHGENTPLHRGFSCYIFRSTDGRLLLQQRSPKKKTWPLVWSNSCCGHPGLAESTVDAARRRIKYELGFEPTFLQEVIGYRYCVTKDGVMENEICPILVGTVETDPVPHPDEVHEISWTTWDAFLEEVEQHPERYSGASSRSGFSTGRPPGNGSSTRHEATRRSPARRSSARSPLPC